MHVLDLGDSPIARAHEPADEQLVRDARDREQATGAVPPVSTAVSEGFPPESDEAVAAIEYLLARHPRISSLLADNRWAARDIWRVVRDRPQYLGFTHIDNLERARRAGVQPDVGAKGRRRASHRFSFEFAGDQPLHWHPNARVRVLIGPGNHYGRASAWARVARTIDGVDALALSVGPHGYPAELMATPADWETKAVRDEIGAWIGSATHVILDDAADEIVAALRLAANGKVIRAEGGRLPVAAPLPSPRRARSRPHAVVIGRGRPVLPAAWRVTRLQDVPRSLWVLQAMDADVIVDTREPAYLDMPVIAAMSRGAALLADLPRRRVPFSARVPHLPLSAVDRLDARQGERLAAASRRYTQQRHGDNAIARHLRRLLRVR